MPTCCASGCKSRPCRGKKLFSIPRGTENAARRQVWLQRIGLTDFEPGSSRLCEDHFSEDQFEPILLQMGTKKLKRDATPTVFSHQQPRAQASATSPVDAQGGLFSSQGHAGTDCTPRSCPEEASLSSECDTPIACSQGAETTRVPSRCQSFRVLTSLAESQQRFPTSCGNAEFTVGTANVAGSSSKSPTTHDTVAGLHKRIAALEYSVKSMKRKIASLQQQKSRASRRNLEFMRKLKKYLASDHLQCMEMSIMRGKQWSTDKIQKGLKLRLACGSCGYSAIRELAVSLPIERTLQRCVQEYKFLPGILHKVLQSLTMKVIV